jgi:hypothetical protein
MLFVLKPRARKIRAISDTEYLNEHPSSIGTCPVNLQLTPIESRIRPEATSHHSPSPVAYCLFDNQLVTVSGIFHCGVDAASITGSDAQNKTESSSLLFWTSNVIDRSLVKVK